MKKSKKILISVLFALVFVFTVITASPALAVDEQNLYEGYIFKVAEDMPAVISLMGETTEGVEPIAAASGYYTADSLADIEAFAPQQYIEYIEPNYKVSLFAYPNDNLYATYQKDYMELINLAAAWNVGLNGSGVTVAVIDSGLIPNHADMDYSKVLTGVNYTEETLNNNTVDTTGHGSFISGIIAAQTDNTLGIAGVTENVNILPLKCFQNGDDATLSMVIAAIGYAVDHGADVINMSFGMTAYSEALETAVNNAAAAGVILVAAVGNDGTSVLSYPAAYSNVIGVGSVNKLGVVSEFSQKNSSVYITAPGEIVTSIGYTGSTVYNTGSGTSYAAPFIAAIAAMAKQYDSDVNMEGFQNLLTASAADRGVAGYDTSYGWGIADLQAFVLELQDTYNITYELNGGSFAEPLAVAQSFTVQSPTITLTAPQKKAYVFGGWYDNAGFLGDAVTEIAAGSVGDVTLYAKWIYNAQADTAVSQITVNGHTATAAGSSTYNVTLPYGSNLAELTAAQITVTPVSSFAVVGTPVSADGGVTWTVLVTAGNATDTETYTINITVPDTFVPVTSVSSVPAAATVGVALNLTGVVAPVDASRQTIVWTVKDAATTGAFITGSSFSATAPGNAIITATIVNGTADGTDYVQDFTITISAPALGGGGGGGGGTVVVEEKVVEAQVLSANSAIAIPCTVNGSEISLVTTQAILAAVSENAQKSGIALLDASAIEGAQSLNISVDALSYLAGNAFKGSANGVLQIKLPQAEIKLDAAALASILEQAAGKELQFSVNTVAENKLNEKQQAATDGLNVYDLTFLSGSTKISKFTGEVSFSLYYKLGSAEAAKAVAVWYLDDAGKLHSLACAYDEATHTAKFKVSHLSYYAVGYEPMFLWANPFADIEQAAWYYSAVRFVNYNKFFSGTDENEFAPQTAMSRAMFVTVLSRLNGIQSQSYTAMFTDVPNGKWFTAAVQWAASNAIVSGMAENTFAPEQPISREQIAVILYNYAKVNGLVMRAGTELTGFADGDEVSAWALTAVKWAVGEGLLSGKGNGMLAPTETATRAEVAAITQRFTENVD